MGYFNFFDEWAMDPKVQSMSETMQRRHAMLLCLRNIGDTCDTPDEDVATFMRIGMAEARKTKELFNRKGFIDGIGWNVKHWEKRQDGQSESLQRVRKHRAKERYSNGSVTLQDRDSNATETLPRARADLLTSLPTTVTTGGKGDAAPPLEVAGLGPEFARVGELAMNMTGDLSWGAWVQQQALAGHSAADLEAAIKEASGVGKLGKGYTIKILQRWAVEGRPTNGKHPKPPPTPEQLAKDADEIKRIDDRKRAALQRPGSKPHG